MPLIVQKFGGTSLEGISRVLNAAEIVYKEWEKGSQVVVVVSAMAGVTNQLVDFVKALEGDSQNPESDAVISTGEQITAGLLSLALQQKGIQSRSWTGPQVPIMTDGHHGEADILSIHGEALHQFLATGGISVVTGFQGLSPEGRVTTLGRGGSDTTAVALAAFLKADRCDIYTDVEGVYTADPRLVADAQKIDTLSYDEMLALSEHGAKVLHPRAVYYAQKYGVPVRVLSSFTFQPGTLISFQTSGPQPLFGLTYTLGWVLVESKKPLNFQAEGGRKIVYHPCSKKSSYLAVLSGQNLKTEQEKSLTEIKVLNDNLASVSVVNGALDKHGMKTLRMRFLKTLSDSELPPFYMQATSSLHWKLWFDQEDLPTALGLLHRRLQGTSV